MSKIISKATAQRWIRGGYGREVGTVVSDGWRWMAVENTNTQETAHYRIERGEGETMNAEHTPGPWRTNPDQPGMIETESGEMIGDTWSKDGNRQARINARLVAAAPELLAALDTIINAIDVWRDNLAPGSIDNTVLERVTEVLQDAHGKAIDKARAAIAKATGDA